MRTILTILTIFFSALLLCAHLAYAQETQAPYQIDQQATAQAPWKVDDIITFPPMMTSEPNPYYRKFLGITTKGYFLIQDFYINSDQKFTTPYTLLSQADITQSSDKLINGVVIYWSEQGQKTGEDHYQDGKLHGTWTRWYDNGQKSDEMHYQNDKLDGTWTRWYENGQKRSEVLYRNDEKEHYIKWDENGRKTTEIWFENDIQVRRQDY